MGYGKDASDAEHADEEGADEYLPPHLSEEADAEHNDGDDEGRRGVLGEDEQYRHEGSESHYLEACHAGSLLVAQGGKDEAAEAYEAEFGNLAGLEAYESYRDPSACIVGFLPDDEHGYEQEEREEHADGAEELEVVARDEVHEPRDEDAHEHEGSVLHDRLPVGFRAEGHARTGTIYLDERNGAEQDEHCPDAQVAMYEVLVL